MVRNLISAVVLHTAHAYPQIASCHGVDAINPDAISNNGAQFRGCLEDGACDRRVLRQQPGRSCCHLQHFCFRVSLPDDHVIAEGFEDLPLDLPAAKVAIENRDGPRQEVPHSGV